MKSSVALVASLAALTVASSAQALEMANEMYVVGSIGQSNIMQTSMQVDNNAIIAGNLGSSTGFHSSQESSKRGAKLQLGYQFDPNFAIEVGYIDLGKTTYAATYATTTTTTRPVFSWWPKGPQTTTSTSATGNTSREAKLTGWNVSGVGFYPIDDKFSILGKLGLFRAQVKTNDGGAGFSSGADSTSTKWKLSYGVGGDYKFDNNFGLRAEFERFSKLGESESTGAVDVNLLSLGLIGRF